MGAGAGAGVGFGFGLGGFIGIKSAVAQLLEWARVNLEYSGKTTDKFLVLFEVKFFFVLEPDKLARTVSVIGIVTIVSFHIITRPGWLPIINEHGVIDMQRREI